MRATAPRLRLDRLFGVWLIVQAIDSFGADWVAVLFYVPDAQDKAARAWGYVFDSVYGALAAATLVAGAAVLDIVRAATPLVAIWIWAALNQAECATCRLLFPMDRAPPKVGLFEGLCDVATGLPVYKATLLVVLVWLALERRALHP